jgi:hypothetical protein
MMIFTSSMDPCCNLVWQNPAGSSFTGPCRKKAVPMYTFLVFVCGTYPHGIYVRGYTWNLICN